MDGLSAGASVIAVISLVVQLGGAAHDLVKFLETMSDAPSEIKRLRDLLGMVFAVSTGVRNVLEGQRRLHGDCVPIEEAIHTALLDCQRTILQIQDLVNKVDTGKAGSGRHMVSRSWARLRMTLKKDEVAELETKLGQALQMLNLTLTMILM